MKIHSHDYVKIAFADLNGEIISHKDETKMQNYEYDEIEFFFLYENKSSDSTQTVMNIRDLCNGKIMANDDLRKLCLIIVQLWKFAVHINH